MNRRAACYCGGFEVSGLGSDGDNELVIQNSFPSDNDTWSVTAGVDNPGDFGDDASFAIRAYALCVTAL